MPSSLHFISMNELFSFFKPVSSFINKEHNTNIACSKLLSLEINNQIRICQRGSQNLSYTWYLITAAITFILLLNKNKPMHTRRFRWQCVSVLAVAVW
jgi:hypothetical protein